MLRQHEIFSVGINQIPGPSESKKVLRVRCNISEVEAKPDSRVSYKPDERIISTI